MKLIKFSQDKKLYLAEFKDGKIFPIKSSYINLDIFDEFDKYIGEPLSIDKIEVMPFLPKGKIVYALAENYKSKKDPMIFFKSLSDSAIHMNEKLSISASKEITKIWAEAELGFIVSKSIEYGSKFKIDQKYIFGYFLANDITGTFKDEDHHLLCSKSSEGFLQLGNIVDLDFKPNNNNIKLSQDGYELRKGEISERKMSDIEILNFVRKHIRINSGDAILTGAPSRCRDRMYLGNKNQLELSIDKLDSIKSELTIKRF